MAIKVTQPEINLRETLKDLDKPSGTAGQAMLRAETPQEQFNLIGAGRRNLIINGGFTVSQRGSYSSATSASTASYYLDRWNMDISAVTTTIANSAADLPNGITVKTAKVASTSSATGYMQIRQKIEVEDWMDNRVYTLSAWVKSNTSYPRLRIESAGPTLGNIDSEQTHSGSGNWEYLTMTFTSGNSIVNFNAGVIDWAGAATRAITSGDYFEVANIQLELGKVATPFEHRSYGEELALCQRYYYQLGGIGGVAAATSLSSGSMYTATAVNLYVPFPVPMRSSPGISKTVNGTGNWLNLYVGSTGTTGNPTPQVGDNGTDSARVYIPSAHSGNSPSAAGAGVWAILLSGASLNFSAEIT